MPSNKNVELGGRDGFKYFKHGVSSYMLPQVRRINGGWWISIARQLQIFFCVTKIISDTTRTKFCEALSLLFEVHDGLRNPVHKDDLGIYQGKINFLLTALVDIALPWSPSQCQSIKYHWPRHWAHTRQVYTYHSSFHVWYDVCFDLWLMYDLMYELMYDLIYVLMYVIIYVLLYVLIYFLIFLLWSAGAWM